MDVTSTYKFARVSARKARDVAREIQGLPVSAALDILTFTPRKSAELIGKTMKAALADAENNFELAIDGLFVKEASIGEGPTFKRWKARARGSASPIRKRTSHIRIVLSDDALEEPKESKKHVSEEKRTDEKKKAPAKKAAAKKAKAEPVVAEVKEEAIAPEAPAPAASGESGDSARGLVYDSKPDNADDLKEINGVGPKLEEELNNFGIYTFAQIADWKQEQIDEFDGLLSFKGRIERDEWVAKATELAKG